MLLTEEEKQNKRKELEIKCEKKNLISKIRLERIILEQLLFTFENEYKFVTWSGEFLKKIDLKDVSFDNVWWGNIAYKDFEGANVVLDFSKCYCPFYDHSIRYCNFSSFDLSDSSIETFDTYEFIDFGRTKLPEKFGNGKRFSHCNFKNSDLSITLDSRTLYSCFFGCNLSNTNTVIIHKEKKLSHYDKTVIEDYREYNDIITGLPLGEEEAAFYYKKMKKIESEYEELIMDMKSSEYLDIAMQNGFLNGCTINDDRKSSLKGNVKRKINGVV